MTNTIVVLDGYCVNPGDLDWSELSSLGQVSIYDRTSVPLVVKRQGSSPIMLTNKCNITKEVIDALPALKYIGVLATGYNNIDIEYARLKGIVVTNVPSYATESVVQTVFGLILELYSKIGAHNASVHNGDWVNCSDFCYYKGINELSGRTIGIIGCGKIGKRVALVAETFGMQVVGYNKGKTGVLGTKGEIMESLDEMLAKSDIVSLNCPLNADNHKLINKATISKMKQGAVLINTARGGLVDEKALAEALKTGRLSGAGLDVLSTEPPKSTNPLLSSRNTVITPHLGWATHEARARLLRIAIANVKAFLDGQPQNKVN